MTTARDSMDALNATLEGLSANLLGRLINWPVWISLFLPFLALAAFGLRRESVDEPWSLPNWKGIPLFGNTVQYIVDNESFLARLSFALRTRDIAKFYLGPIKVYLISGPQNVQALFRKSSSISADKFNLMTMEALMCYTKPDLAKFASDKTGRLAEPTEGTIESHKGVRYWYEFHHLMKNLSQITTTKMLTEKFVEFFEERVQVFPVGKAVEVNLYHFMNTDMAVAAIRAFTGNRLFERFGEDDVLKRFWDYDSVVIRLLYALPKWIDPHPWRMRAKARDMCLEWLQKDFDPALEEMTQTEADEVDWHPATGLRFIKDFLAWTKESGLEDVSRAGHFLGFMLGLNANSIPIAAWALMEIIQDQVLLKEVQAEADTAFQVDASTGKRVLDVQKMLGLPVLQSVYAEALRLHVSVNLTREVVDTVTVAGYKLSSKSLIQAPTRIALYNERAWGVDGHPASEFWAHRHIKYVETQDEAAKTTRTPEFSLAAGPNEFIPYGGGVSMCPGRHFAKQEIMATVAFMVTIFNIEFVEWRSFDGKTKSDRPARENPKYSGSASMPPDRDMKVRWTRRY